MIAVHTHLCSSLLSSALAYVRMRPSTHKQCATVVSAVVMFARVMFSVGMRERSLGVFVSCVQRLKLLFVRSGCDVVARVVCVCVRVLVCKFYLLLVEFGRVNGLTVGMLCRCAVGAVGAVEHRKTALSQHSSTLTHSLTPLNTMHTQKKNTARPTLTLDHENGHHGPL